MPGRIAVLDDNIDCGQIVNLLLSPEYDVDVFVRTDLLMDALFDGKYDMAIVDMMLDGQFAGLDVLKFVRSTSHIYDLPVLLVTGDNFRFNSESALREGFDGFLVKPFDFEDLSKFVSQLTARRARKSAA